MWLLTEGLVDRWYINDTVLTPINYDNYNSDDRYQHCTHSNGNNNRTIVIMIDDDDNDNDNDDDDDDDDDKDQDETLRCIALRDVTSRYVTIR